MVKIQYHRTYETMYVDLMKKQPQLKKDIDAVVERFQNNPDDSRLFTHPLHKRLQGRYACSVTGDIRIVFEWIGKTTVRFLAIGSHKNVYGSQN